MTPDNRRCLSIRQPWAWLIIRPDLPAESPERLAWLTSQERKDIENRTWGTSYRGTLYIHAGLKVDAEAYRGIKKAFPQIPLPALDEFQPGSPNCGGIIGRVRFIGIVEIDPSPWFTGPKGWKLEEPEALPFEPLTGAQGLFIAGNTRPLKAKAKAEPEPALMKALGHLLPAPAECQTCHGTGKQGVFPCAECFPLIQSAP